MFLNATTLPHYLASRGLIEWEEVVTGLFRIEESGRRNRNFKVRRGSRPGLFVKQVPVVVGETVASVFREAACYQLAEERPAFACLRGWTPKLVDYDPRLHCLVTELLPPSEGFTQIHFRLRFPTEEAGLLGAALARYHRDTATAATPADTVAFPRTPPWVLTIARNAESVFGNMGPGTRQLVGVLRSMPELVAKLEALHAGWRQRALINGDLKWDNLLVRSDPDSGKTLYVLDWELSDIGDPAWDLGCALGAYLQHWLSMLSADASAQDITEIIRAAPYRIEELAPAASALWEAYVRGMGFSEIESLQELWQAAAFTGARLVLTAFEIANQSSTVSRTMMLCLQMASAMLAQPERAIREVLGLRPVLPGSRLASLPDPGGRNRLVTVETPAETAHQ